MAQSHLSSNQLGSVAPLGARIAGTPSFALVKGRQLEVMRLTLPAGKSLPEHSAPGEITVQCLEGRVCFEAGGQRHDMQPGDFLYLQAGQPHALQAVTDASLLLTVCLMPFACS